MFYLIYTFSVRLCKLVAETYKQVKRHNTPSNPESLALDQADKEQQQEMHRHSQSNPIKQRFWIVTANQIQSNKGSG